MSINRQVAASIAVTVALLGLQISACTPTDNPPAIASTAPTSADQIPTTPSSDAGFDVPFAGMEGTHPAFRSSDGVLFCVLVDYQYVAVVCQINEAVATKLAAQGAIPSVSRTGMEGPGETPTASVALFDRPAASELPEVGLQGAPGAYPDRVGPTKARGRVKQLRPGQSVKSSMRSTICRATVTDGGTTCELNGHGFALSAHSFRSW